MSSGPGPDGPTRRGLPFLGGLASAALLYLAWENDSLAAAAWLGLTPFFYSVLRARESVRARFAHGLSLLAPLALVHYRGAAELAASAAQAAFFAAACAPVLRASGSVVHVVGLSSLWAGVEVLRGLAAPTGLPVAPGWLALGSTLAPGGGESQLAGFVGVSGLSLAVAAASACFANVLVAGGWRPQLGWTAAGIAIAMACQLSGGALLARRPDVSAAQSVIRVAVQSTGSVEILARLTRAGQPPHPDLTVWPFITPQPAAAPDAPPWSDRALLDAAGSQGTSILAACGAPGAELNALLALPSGSAVKRPLGRGSAASFNLPQGELAAASGDALTAPAAARGAAAAGATLLVSLAREPGHWSAAAVRHAAVLGRYRAVECRRWLVHAGWRTAFVADPRGRQAAVLDGFDGAADAGVEWLAETSFYCRWGWWIEPLAALSAAGLLAGSIIGALLRRR